MISDIGHYSRFINQTSHELNLSPIKYYLKSEPALSLVVQLVEYRPDYANKCMGTDNVQKLPFTNVCMAGQQVASLVSMAYLAAYNLRTI